MAKSRHSSHRRPAGTFKSFVLLARLRFSGSFYLRTPTRGKVTIAELWHRCHWHFCNCHGGARNHYARGDAISCQQYSDCGDSELRDARINAIAKGSRLIDPALAVLIDARLSLPQDVEAEVVAIVRKARAGTDSDSGFVHN